MFLHSVTFYVFQLKKEGGTIEALLKYVLQFRSCCIRINILGSENDHYRIVNCADFVEGKMKTNRCK